MDQDTYKILRDIADGSDGISRLNRKDMMRQARFAIKREDQRVHDDILVLRATAEAMKATRGMVERFDMLRDIEEKAKS